MIYLIAEIGINHDGNLDTAIKLIKQAKKANFQAVKFQKRDIESLYNKSKLNSYRKGYKNYFEYKKKLEFGEQEYQEISKICEKLNLDWIISVWDKKSVEFFNNIDWDYKPKYLKIPSPQNINIGLLKKLKSKTNKYKVILSTGMATIEQIKKMVNILNSKIEYILHCVSSYPCLDNECNLESIIYLNNCFPDYKIGYSSHSTGILAPITALGLKAKAIEVHITYNRAAKGSDHSSSLEFPGMEKLAKASNIIPTMLGIHEKKIMSCEYNDIGRLRGGLRNLCGKTL